MEQKQRICTESRGYEGENDRKSSIIECSVLPRIFAGRLVGDSTMRAAYCRPGPLTQ